LKDSDTYSDSYIVIACFVLQKAPDPAFVHPTVAEENQDADADGKVMAQGIGLEVREVEVVLVGSSRILEDVDQNLLAANIAGDVVGIGEPFVHPTVAEENQDADDGMVTAQPGVGLEMRKVEVALVEWSRMEGLEKSLLAANIAEGVGIGEPSSTRGGNY
jgi:hypothetical protein